MAMLCVLPWIVKTKLHNKLILTYNVKGFAPTALDNGNGNQVYITVDIDNERQQKKVGYKKKLVCLNIYNS